MLGIGPEAGGKSRSGPRIRRKRRLYPFFLYSLILSTLFTHSCVLMARFIITLTFMSLVGFEPRLWQHPNLPQRFRRLQLQTRRRQFHAKAVSVCSWILWTTGGSTSIQNAPIMHSERTDSGTASSHGLSVLTTFFSVTLKHLPVQYCVCICLCGMCLFYNMRSPIMCSFLFYGQESESRDMIKATTVTGVTKTASYRTPPRQRNCHGFSLFWLK